METLVHHLLQLAVDRLEDAYAIGSIGSIVSVLMLPNCFLLYFFF
jgi:hypothetical protein